MIVTLCWGISSKSPFGVIPLPSRTSLGMGVEDFPIENEPGSILMNFMPMELVKFFFAGISAEKAVVVRIKMVISDIVLFMEQLSELFFGINAALFSHYCDFRPK